MAIYLSVGSRIAPPSRSRNPLALSTAPSVTILRLKEFFLLLRLKRTGIKKEKKKEGEVNPYQALRMIQEYLDKNFEDVGMSFAKEALKMHWGESEKRNIKGTATPQEEGLAKRGRGTILQGPDHQTSGQLRF